MSKIKFYNFFWIIIHVFIVAVIILSVVYCASYDYIEHDDFEVLFMPWHKNFFDFLVDNYHGRTLINLLTSFIGVVLPKIFSVHPIEWMHNAGAIIKGIFISIICYQLAAFVFLFYKPGIKPEKPSGNSKFTYKEISFYNIVLASFSLVFYCCYLKMFSNSYMSELYAAFYGFTFPFIIYFFYLRKFVIAYFPVSQSCDCSHHSFVLCVLLFFVGMSSEFFSFSSIAALFYLIIFEKFILKNSVKYFLPYLISITIGFILYITNHGFIGSWCEKLSNVNISLNQYFKEFFYEIYNVFINDFIGIVAASIMLFCIVIYVNKDNRVRIFILFLSFYLGILSFYLSLFFGGMREGYIFISHIDIILQIKIALSALILLQTAFLIKNLKIYTAVLLIIFLILSSISSKNLLSLAKLIFISDYKPEYINQYTNHSQSEYNERFINEYIFIYYLLTDSDTIFLSADFPINTIVGSYYTNVVYNIEFNSLSDNSKKLKTGSLKEVYNEYLKTGGTPIPEYYDENIRADFNKLLNRANILKSKSRT